MPISQLDPIAALVVIDLQKGIVSMPTVHSTADVVARSAALAKAFRAKGLPVVLVNVEGRAPGRTANSRPFSPPVGWAELVPELDAQPTDHLVTKYNVGAFYGTNLERVLRRAGVTQVILTGVSTSSGVESTARAAYDHGYNVVTVIDAMTDLDAEAHKNSVERQFIKIGETATTDEVLAKLG